MKKESIYFNPYKYLPYQRNFIMVASERTIGKTYSTQMFQLNRFLKYGERFLYIVRYQDEKKSGVFASAYSKVIMEQFNEDEWIFRSNLCYHKDLSNETETLAGICVAISEANKTKRINYPACRWGMFDEYIVEDIKVKDYVGGWNEPNLLLKTYHTIDRENDYLTIFMLANTIKFYNPYHMHKAFAVKPVETGEIYLGKNVLYTKIEASNELKEKKKKSKFLSMIEGTEYGDYAINGEFVNDVDTLLMERPARAKLKFNLDVDEGTVGIWWDNVSGLVYVDNKFNQNNTLWYTTDVNKMDEHKILIKGKEAHLIKWMSGMYKRGNLRWTSMKVKEKSFRTISKLL